EAVADIRKRRLQIESVRLQHVRLRRELALHAGRAGYFVEAFLLQVDDGGHELIERERRQPLRYVLEIARVKRQGRSATRFPNAMAVAEAGESGFVPVLDDRHPGVAKGLSGRGSERGIDADRVVVRGMKRIPKLVET